MNRKRSIKGIFLARLLAAIVLLAVAGWGQGTIDAQITGGGGNGKCTFEVRVDGVANVQIRGNQGYIQNKSGMPAQWVRLKCNQPLPRNPNNFRFAGVDGRGKQYLLKSPNGNNGVAVIRIEDNRQGMEGYTGDIFWSGGNNSGGNWNGGWWNDNWNGGGDWGGGGGGNQNPSGEWQVQSASYGSGNRRQDVTGNVRRLVNGPDFNVNNVTMGGDPVVGTEKNLQIIARSQNGTMRTFTYNEGATVNSRMFSGGWGGGGGGNNNDWGNGNNNNDWNKNNVVMSCQNTIRRKIQQDAGGASVNFNGSPRVNKSGSFVMVDGNGSGRANNGSQRTFTYHCSMHTNGNVADSSYNLNGGNPQPR